MPEFKSEIPPSFETQAAQAMETQEAALRQLAKEGAGTPEDKMMREVLGQIIKASNGEIREKE